MPRPTDQQLRRLAAACVVVSLACSIGAVALHLAAQARSPEVPVFAWSNLAFGATWPLAGLVVVRAQPRNRCGWLLVGTSWISVYQLLGEYSIWNAYVSDLPFSDFTDWTSMWGFAVYLLVLPLVPLLFPDGRLPSRRWWPFAWSIVIAASTLAVCRMLVPGRSDIDPNVVSPLDLPGLDVLNYVVLASALYCNLVGIPVAIVAVLLRIRRSVGVERAQLQWLALGGVFVLVSLLLSAFPETPPAVFALGLLGIPFAIAVAVVRHRLFDIDVVLGRSVVFVAVLAVVMACGAWLLLRLDPEVAGTRRGVFLIAALAVSAVLLRAAVQHGVDRWLFPERESSRLLGRRIADAMSGSTEPREALRELVAAVRSTMRLPYVGFSGPGTPSVESGRRPDHVVALDAVAMGREVGILEIGPRREGEGFTRQERQVLEESAAQAAMLAYAAGLVSDVKRSRSSIVGAREEERRRLRNDLHDGVGPSLAAIALQADVLASHLRESEHGDHAVLIRDRLRETVADVRSVSHGLRPPILDQVGLEEALRQLVSGIEPLVGEADVPSLPDLPAAVEVATYVIAAEAVTNAVKHSAASRVRLEARRTPDGISLTVSDNGRGLPSHPRPGVGLTSMRQRAAELEGTLDHRTPPGGGTAVHLTIPLPEERP
ncbi:two-component sensor histidine kinase [Aeromicrobium sp. Marseille-Q0843]|uniref:histidine kinase n=1 Tax=Aeromicrobium phoceense TaxID=2754045 RepID=A0A838XD59_9ACTN|nr:two-component sensor histidine kinase [Aeromicrobium phoceense]